MTAVAVDVTDENVGGVWLGTEAVIANVYPGVAHCEAVYVVAVPAIGVFGKDLFGEC